MKFDIKSLFVFLNSLIFVCSQPISTPSCYLGDNAQRMNERFLKEHNAYRSLHGVPPLELDPTLMDSSRQWSEKMAADGKIALSSTNNVGENLYGMLTMAQVDESMINPSEAWYNTKEKYQGSYSPNSGHFTQMVWKNTQKMGCGICSSGNMTAVTCRYLPPGNLLSLDQFKENVLPVTDSSTILTPAEGSIIII